MPPTLQSFDNILLPFSVHYGRIKATFDWGCLMHKKMMGDTIYRLRKERGMSQAKLGKAVGVSNKAVSKWETYEANPDINLLPLLAKALGVSVEELLTDAKAEKEEPKAVNEKVFGVLGTVLRTAEAYEFVSDRKTRSGMPYLHIHIGRHISMMNARAKGLIAIGNIAKGVVAIGLFGIGFASLGIVSVGLLSLGLFALGLASTGMFANGFLYFCVVCAIWGDHSHLPWQFWNRNP